MQRHHVGSGRRTPIPADWAPTLASSVTKSLASASVVRIGLAGGAATWDEGLGRMVTTAADPVYSGPADLMLVSDPARAVTVVEDPTSTEVYDVTLPYAAGAGIEVDHVIFVQAGDPDPMLADRDLRVAAIERGSRRFSRVLLAVLLD